MPSIHAFFSGRRFGTLLIGIGLAATTASAAPLFLGVTPADAETKPRDVMAGRTNEFVLTLTSTAVENPQLRASLSATAGGIVAPLFKAKPLDLVRVDQSHAGIQRFKFQLEVPPVQNPQAMVLQLEVRTATADWLPLPAVLLRASPLTWTESLRRFVQVVPSGRQSGSAKLEQLFHQAKLEPPQISPGEPGADPAVRVWFAETESTEFQPSDAAQAVWIVFKPGVRDGLEVWRPAGTSLPCVAVDAGVLAKLDSDPAAQEIFARALMLAHILSSNPPAQTPP